MRMCRHIHIHLFFTNATCVLNYLDTEESIVSEIPVASTSASVTTEIELENEDMVIGSEDKSSSNVICRREVSGTKRKAEVLSKESGKIGVTITTSSPPHTAAKVQRLATPVITQVNLLYIADVF